MLLLTNPMTLDMPELVQGMKAVRATTSQERDKLSRLEQLLQVGLATTQHCIRLLVHTSNRSRRGETYDHQTLSGGRGV